MNHAIYARRFPHAAGIENIPSNEKINDGKVSRDEISRFVRKLFPSLGLNDQAKAAFHLVDKLGLAGVMNKNGSVAYTELENGVNFFYDSIGEKTPEELTDEELLVKYILDQTLINNGVLSYRR